MIIPELEPFHVSKEKITVKVTFNSLEMVSDLSSGSIANTSD